MYICGIYLTRTRKRKLELRAIASLILSTNADSTLAREKEAAARIKTLQEQIGLQETMIKERKAFDDARKEN